MVYMGSKFAKLDYDSDHFRKCKKHGVLPIEFFYEFNQKTRHGKSGKVFRCKECIKKKRTDQYEADPKASKDATGIWKARNRERSREITTASYHKNKDKYLPRYREKRLERRLLVLRHYAGGEPQCSLCLEQNHEFLVLDHIEGGGTAHRKELGSSRKGEKFYKWVISQNYPPGLRVLCHNCNLKEHFRYNREGFSVKVWDDSNSYKTRIIDGKEYPVNRQLSAEASKKYKVAIKLECLIHYSSIIPSCACCHLEDVETLSIDHIDGGGRKHREETGFGNQFYQWLRKNDFPEGYRVLCLNCNFSYGAYKRCPHQEKSK